MTIKIGDVNNVLQQIYATLGHLRSLAYESDNFYKIAVANIVDLVKDSQGMLGSVIDDMGAEGGRDRDGSQ